MPYKPGRPCRHPGCPAIVKGKSGYCPAHEKKVKKQYESQPQRIEDKRFYSDRKWRRLRKMKLAADPMCQKCEEKASVLVHHIDDVKHHPEKKMEWGNLLSLCNDCHESIHRPDRWGGGGK